MEIFCLERRKLADEARVFIPKEINRLLKDLHYPFDDHSDFSASESLAANLVDALKCYSDILLCDGSTDRE